MSKKLFISAALCGAGTTREKTPYLPITPEEIAEDAVACAKAGAAIVHIHARDKDGNNTMDTDRFCEVVNLIRKRCAEENVDVILNLTTSGSKFDEELRMAHLGILKPEMCSYDPGTLNWANSYVFMNPPAFLKKLGLRVQELNIKPECEIFDAGMMGSVDYYVKNGYLKGPVHYQFMLGVAGGMDGSLGNLAFLLPKMQPGSTWSISGIGIWHKPCMLAGLAAGCDGIRVGLEDNVYLDKGVLGTNAQLVEQAVTLAKDAGRTIATAEETRAILGLTKHI